MQEMITKLKSVYAEWRPVDWEDRHNPDNSSWELYSTFKEEYEETLRQVFLQIGPIAVARIMLGMLADLRPYASTDRGECWFDALMERWQQTGDLSQATPWELPKEPKRWDPYDIVGTAFEMLVHLVDYLLNSPHEGEDDGKEWVVVHESGSEHIEGMDYSFWATIAYEEIGEFLSLWPSMVYAIRYPEEYIQKFVEQMDRYRLREKEFMEAELIKTDLFHRLLEAESDT